MALEELVETAEGICGGDEQLLQCLEDVFRPAAIAYTELCENLVGNNKKEFFGLRDFYSFIKMLVYFAKQGRYMRLNEQVVRYAITRNFGGFQGVQAVDLFLKHIKPNLSSVLSKWPGLSNQGCNALGKIFASYRLKLLY